MLDILQKHMENVSEGCSVNSWINSLQPAEKHAFETICVNSNNINCAALFKDLNSTEKLPFRMTAFRSHLRGYCTCPKN